MRVDDNGSSVDAGSSPLEMSATDGRGACRRGSPWWGRRVGVALIAELDLADGVESAGIPERLEVIGYRPVTDHSAPLRSQATYRGGFGAR